MKEGGEQAPWSRATEILERCAWVVLPAVGMVWVATRYHDNWYVADEWLMFARTISPKSWLSSAFAGTFGHLMVPTYAMYTLQRAWFGVEGHQLVWVVFCFSLGALQVSIALLLRRLGVAPLTALLAAGVVVFFGAGAQDMIWEFQLGVNLAFSASFLAAFVALGRKQSRGMALVVAGLLVLAVGLDSGLALLGAVYVGILLFLLWPRRHLPLALGPPALANLAWLAFGTGATYPRESIGTMTSFGWHLFTLAAGGLVGGGETKRAIGIAVGGSPRPSPTIPLSGETVGIVVLLFATLCAVLGLARRQVSPEARASLIGGFVAAIVTVGSLAKTRAFIPPVMLPSGGSRFIQWTALFFLVAFLPAIATVLRPASWRWREFGALAAAAALVAVFLMNLGQLRPIRRFQEATEMHLKLEVRQAITVLYVGCGPGKHINLHATFKDAGIVKPITVGLVRELLIRGDLEPGFRIPASDEFQTTVCPTSTRPTGASGSLPAPERTPE